MERYQYVIIGGGMTGDAAVEGIREIDKENSILLVSAETNPPYDRPPLTKGLWKEKSVADIWRGTKDKNIDLKLNTRIVEINSVDKYVTDSEGNTFSYVNLLIASGGTPRKLPFGGDLINYYRTLEDYRKLSAKTEEAENFAVIGSGFIGSEISAGLSMNDKKVVLFDVGPGIAWKVFPDNVVDYLNNYYKKRNVRLVTKTVLKDVVSEDGGFSILTKNGDEYSAEFVLAGIGIKPNVELGESIGLKVDNGIHVDEHLRTTDPAIYAAGDVANFYNPLLMERIRIEHEDNANAMGKQAGRNMAGAGEVYDYLPMFYSDLFDVGYEAVGILDSRFQIVQDWQEEFKKGLLYYLNNDRLRGVLLWNVWDQLDHAREMLALEAPVKEKDLIGKIN